MRYPAIYECYELFTNYEELPNKHSILNLPLTPRLPGLAPSVHGLYLDILAATFDSPPTRRKASMALKELQGSLGRRIWRICHQCGQLRTAEMRRWASSNAAAPSPLEDLEQTSFSGFPPSNEAIESFDPVKQANKRAKQLPPSR